MKKLLLATALLTIATAAHASLRDDQDRLDALEEACRAPGGPNAETDKACADVDKLTKELDARGYCVYGHGVIGRKGKGHCYAMKLPASPHASWNTRFALPKVPLPAEMLGSWCLDESASRNDNVSYYNRGEDCVYNAPLHIRPDGWSEMWDNCPFTKVEKEPNGGYLIYSYCEILAEGDGHGIGKYFSEHSEYRLEDGLLVITKVPEK